MPTDLFVPGAIPDPVKGDKGDKGDQGLQGVQGVQGVQGLTGGVGPAAPPAVQLGDKVGVAGQTLVIDWQNAADAQATLTLPTTGVVGLSHANVVPGSSLTLTTKSTGNATLNHVDAAGALVRWGRGLKPQPSVGTAQLAVYDVLAFVTVPFPGGTVRIDAYKLTSDLGTS